MTFAIKSHHFTYGQTDGERTVPAGKWKVRVAHSCEYHFTTNPGWPSTYSCVLICVCMVPCMWCSRAHSGVGWCGQRRPSHRDHTRLTFVNLRGSARICGGARCTFTDLYHAAPWCVLPVTQPHILYHTMVCYRRHNGMHRALINIRPVDDDSQRFS